MKIENGNFNRITNLIEEVTEESAKVIGVPTELIHFVGNTEKAVFLSQLIYWSDKGKRSDGYIYKTKREWGAETGLSENQITRFTKIFAERGFLDTKLKKANGSPTIHYKIDIEQIVYSFREFLHNRYPENQLKKTPETSESLTDITPENTHDIPKVRESLSSRNKNNSDFILQDVKMEDTVKNQFPSNVKQDSNKHSAVAEMTKIPENFRPTLDKQYRAMKEFPNISPTYVTEKFVNYYQNSDKRFSATEWQDKWWDWMRRELPAKNIDFSELEKEHEEIADKVENKFFGLTYIVDSKVIEINDISLQAKGVFSESTVRECFQELVESENFGQVGSHYYNLQEYETSPEWRDAVDDELKELGLCTQNVENVG